MKPNAKGALLVELMVVLAITTFIGLVVFHLFQQNEKVFRDQNLILEMQQNTRAVAAQIADEIRMAGQGVPVYSSTFDTTMDEATAAVLRGSDATHLYFRAGVTAIEASVTSPTPFDFILGTPVTITVSNSRIFSSLLGTTPTAGRFVFVWGPCAHEIWGWVRAEVTLIANATNSITLIPRQAGTACRHAGLDGISPDDDDLIQFTAAQSISMEELISFQFDSGSVKRSTVSNASDLMSPSWGAAAEIGQNFAALRFRYYTKEDIEVPAPVNTLAARLSIARIDVHLVGETADTLPTGTRHRLALGLRAIPRNLRIH
jgi:hypothetical protein